MTRSRVWENFWQLKAFKNDEKCFLFHAKSSFYSWDIYIFVQTFRLLRKKIWQESFGWFQSLWSYRLER